MKKLYLLVIVVICLMISGCGENTAPDGYNPKNTNDYVSSVNTNTDDTEKVLSQQDIVDFFVDEYCETELSPINDTMYYSSDGNIELEVSSAKVSYIDLNQDIQILVVFNDNTILSDGQKLRIKISDGLFGKKLSSETTIYNIFFNLLNATNIRYDFSQQQVDSSLSLTNSKFALKTYEYKHNNTAKFVFQERLDNQGNKIIGRDLYCDFYTEVLIR